MILNKPLNVTWAMCIFSPQQVMDTNKEPCVSGASLNPERVFQCFSFHLATRRFKQPLSDTPSTTPHTYFHNAPKRRNGSWCIIHVVIICMRCFDFFLWANSVCESDTYSLAFLAIHGKMSPGVWYHRNSFKSICMIFFFSLLLFIYSQMSQMLLSS